MFTVPVQVYDHYLQEPVTLYIILLVMGSIVSLLANATVKFQA